MDCDDLGEHGIAVCVDNYLLSFVVELGLVHYGIPFGELVINTQ